MRLTNRKTKRGSAIELSMTSMIDIVFLLLIFFLTTAAFIKPEREFNPAIKTKESSASSPQAPRDRAEVRIERGAGGDFVYKLGGNEFASSQELTETLRTAFTQTQKIEDGAFVYADNDAPFGMTAAAVASCKEAGFLGVTYVPADN